MANSLSASFPQVWAKEQQRVFSKVNVSKMIADMGFQGEMGYGNILTRPYRSAGTVQTYTPGSAITIDDLTDTGENLTVNRKFAYGFSRDDFDQIQDKYDVAASYGKDYGIYLSNQVDSDVLGEVLNANASNIVDDGTLAGTSGNGIALTTSNVGSVFGYAKQELAKQNIASTDYFAVISPEFENILLQYLAGKFTSLGDQVSENGYIGSYYGFKIYRSTQLAMTIVVIETTNPSNNDTLVLSLGGTSQTFTYVSSIGTTAGNILIGASATATGDNLVTLLTTPGTTTSTGVALTGTALRKVQNGVSAVNSSGTVTITIKGQGVSTAVGTFTSGNNSVSAVKTIQHQMFGVKGAPTIVMQKEPMSPEVRDVQDKLGKNILGGVLYGVKTFVDNAKMMVDVKIKASSFSV